MDERFNLWCKHDCVAAELLQLHGLVAERGEATFFDHKTGLSVH